jgi:hypothetical protein
MHVRFTSRTGALHLVYGRGPGAVGALEVGAERGEDVEAVVEAALRRDVRRRRAVLGRLLGYAFKMYFDMITYIYIYHIIS